MGFISPFLKIFLNIFLVLKVHWDDPEGWDGEGGGGRGVVQDGEHMYTHGGFMSM